MTLLPLADCARLLGIHPKTLHHWLQQTQLPLTAHPTDARLKCLKQEDLQQLARVHGRSLQLPALSPPQAPRPSHTRGIHPPENKREPDHPAASCAPSCVAETDLKAKLLDLEAKIETLEAQHAQLALALLQVREQSVERQMADLGTLIAQLAASPIVSASLPDLPVSDPGQKLACPPPSSRPLIEAEQRVRSRMPPLIEYGADGTYVIVCSKLGELHLCPDSQEWFDWLATLTSFRFVGQHGRLTAYRKNQERRPTRCWTAHRTLHAHEYVHYLGVTDRLTIARLEQMAAKLQSYVG